MPAAVCATKDMPDQETPAAGSGQTEKPDYLSKQQLAARLGVSIRTIESLMAEKKLPYLRLTRKLVRFPAAEVDNYLARNLRVNAAFDHRDCPLPVSYFERKYGLSRVTLWRYRRAGLPAVGVGAKTFIRESGFVAFLERMNGRTVSAAPLHT
jgi:excisionase family DNA binding protein